MKTNKEKLRGALVIILIIAFATSLMIEFNRAMVDFRNQVKLPTA